MNLIVALGLAQITHVVGIDMTQDRTTCIAIAVLLHLFYTATFTWMLCEGIQLYFKIIAVFDSESKAKRYIYFIIGWGKFLPLHCRQQPNSPTSLFLEKYIGSHTVFLCLIQSAQETRFKQ